MLLFVGCLTSQQHASVSREREEGVSQSGNVTSSSAAKPHQYEFYLGDELRWLVT